jgi:hypothetical protein
MLNFSEMSISEESMHEKSSVVVIHLFPCTCSFSSIFNVLAQHFLFTEDQIYVGVEYKIIFLGEVALGLGECDNS